MTLVLTGLAAAIAFGQARQAEFVTIAPGEFRMGCPEEESECEENATPAHRVRITKGFEIGKYEVTQREWQAVMGTNPSHHRGSDRPVEQVSWHDAQDFLGKLNQRDDGYFYRLPTEAEWEYAARAGSGAEHYGRLHDIAWYSGNSGDQTHPVGLKKPNAWGLHDMLGNVWEWCQDRYGARYYQEFSDQPAIDPAGSEYGEYRVMRGGSWYKYLWFLRVSSRLWDRPSTRYRHVGFRCARVKR